MKIGILTFTDGTNYGQRLQNYALQELLVSYGNDVYTIKQEHHYSIKHRVKVAINNIAHIKQAVIQNKRKNVFDRFNNRYIKFYDQLLPEMVGGIWLVNLIYLLLVAIRFGIPTHRL